MSLPVHSAYPLAVHPPLYMSGQEQIHKNKKESQHSLVKQKSLPELYGVDLTSCALGVERIMRLAESEQLVAEPLGMKNISVNNPDLDDEFEVEEDFEAEEMAEMDEAAQAKQREKKLLIKAKLELEEVANAIKTLGQRYHAWEDNLKNYGNFIDNLLSALEYFKVNDDNLSHLFSLHQLEKAQQALKIAKVGTPWVDPSVSLIYNAVKICIINNSQKELKALDQRFQQAKTIVISGETAAMGDAIQKQIHILSYNLTNDRAKTSTSTILKTEKLFSAFLPFPLEMAFEISGKQAIKICKGVFGLVKCVRNISKVSASYTLQNEWIYHLQSRIIINLNGMPSSNEALLLEANNFLKSLAACKEISEVKSICKRAGMSTPIPFSIEQWETQIQDKRFCLQLFEEYYYCKGKRPTLDRSDVPSFLKKKHERKQSKIPDAVRFIKLEMKACKDKKKDFTEVVKHFKELHMDIQQYKMSDTSLPPASLDDWLRCVEEESFAIHLANQWIEHNATVAQLASQGIRQLLLSKNTVERKFLLFRVLESSINILTSTLQLSLCVPSFALWAASNCMDVIITDLLKLEIPGIGIIPMMHPLYPDITFKIHNIFLQIMKNIFAVQYKPNEYSMNGYGLGMEIRSFGFILYTHYLFSLLQQGLLWSKMRLIENLILRHEKKPFEEDERVIRIHERDERKRVQYKQHIQKLEKEFQNLILKDVQLHLTPDMNREFGEFDPIHNLAEALAPCQLECFPPDVLELFENNFGFKLFNANEEKIETKEEKEERIEKNMKNFFSQGENDFAGSYRKNRFAYMRA